MVCERREGNVRHNCTIKAELEIRRARRRFLRPTGRLASFKDRSCEECDPVFPSLIPPSIIRTISEFV